MPNVMIGMKLLSLFFKPDGAWQIQALHLTYFKPKESHFRGVKLDPLNTRRDILLTNWLQEHLQHIVWRQLDSTLRCYIVLSLEVS